jgi:hypothetical protein
MGKWKGKWYKTRSSQTVPNMSKLWKILGENHTSQRGGKLEF